MSELSSRKVATVLSSVLVAEATRSADNFWPAISGIATAATALVAIFALIVATRDGMERSRPVIIAEYRIPPHANKTLIFVVRNAGASVARNVRVDFDPPLDPPGEGQEMRPYIIERYQDEITTVAPGQEFCNVVTQDLDESKPSDLPLDFLVKVEYRGAWRGKYRDSFRLESRVLGQETYVESSDSVRNQIMKIATGIESLDSSVKSLADSIESQDPRQAARKQAAARKAKRRREEISARLLRNRRRAGDPGGQP